MANPQKEDGFTAIANEIVEKLARTDLSGSELRVILIILRQTWGWRKKEDLISISQFARKTELHIRTVKRALRELTRKNIIFKRNTSDKFIPTAVRKYKFNKDFDTWKTSDIIAPSGKTVPKLVTLLPPTKENNKRNIYSENFNKFISHWNSKEKLRTLRDKESQEKKDTRLELSRALNKGYSLNDILAAVDNYSEVISNPDKFYFSYIWPPSLFLKRGLKQFLSVNSPLQNYLTKERKQDKKIDPIELTRKELEHYG